MSTPFGGGRVVVVGGGIIGVSIAYHLTVMGHSDVCVLDRGNLGEGTTAKATGGIRQQFTSRINALISHRSVTAFQRLAEETGEPFFFRQHGYAFLLSTSAQLAVFRHAVAMQNELGIPSRILEVGDLPALLPEVRGEGLLGAAYCPTDGSASPADAIRALATAARRAGATFKTQVEVSGFVRSVDGRLRGVRTSRGDVSGDAVVIATGPWCHELCQLAGLALPVRIHRRQAFSVGSLPWMRPDSPVTVDLATGAYIHPGTNDAVVGGNDRNVPEGAEVDVDWDLGASLLAAIVERWPSMAQAELRSGWAGLRAMTTDDHAIVGPLPDADRLWVAVGFSGHGFMHAPAIGAALAQLLLTGRSDIDISPLRPSRFAEGAANREDVLF